MGNLAKLDLGRSFSRKQSGYHVDPPSGSGRRCCCHSISLLLAYLLSIPLGLWSSAKSGALAERTLGAVLYMLYSFPTFVAALFLQILLAVQLGWLPLLGMTSDNYASLSLVARPGTSRSTP